MSRSKWPTQDKLLPFFIFCTLANCGNLDQQVILHWQDPERKDQKDQKIKKIGSLGSGSLVQAMSYVKKLY